MVLVIATSDGYGAKPPIAAAAAVAAAIFAAVT